MLNPKCVVAVVVACAASWCGAGDLMPPAGPVAPTMKTLQQVEPRTLVSAATTPGDIDNTFIISRPGSYYLGENLEGESFKNGIRITSSDVTLDLNGFALLGNVQSISGIVVVFSADSSGIVVRNGTISNWPTFGIDLLDAGFGAIVQNVVARNNGSAGIRAGNSSIVMNCTSHDNGFGIIGGNNSVVEGCVAFRNSSTGIITGSAGQVRGCTSRENVLGISVGAASIVVNCNVHSGLGNGIQASSLGCLIEGCVVNNNAQDGIQTGFNSRVHRCQVHANSFDGIQSTGGCDIRGNSVSSHNSAGAAGIRLTSGDSIVDGNQITGNTTGIIASASASGNLIIRNTLAANTTAATLDASNRAAQFITPAANNFVSTDPNANLVY